METKVNKKDIVKHWGLYNVVTDRWITDDSGVILHFTCPRVANIQYEIFIEANNISSDNEIEVKEIK